MLSFVSVHQHQFGILPNGGETTSKDTKMTREAARRIQSSSDKSGKNQSFKARTMRAADSNTKK